MKISLARLLILFLVIAGAAWLVGSHLPKLISLSSPSASWGPLGSIITAIVGGLFLALLGFLITERWRRIESEMLALREAQSKALDDLSKRALMSE